jgi:endonuclease/exonuclease/phosphatase family metal-dependent hydrolase
MKKGIKIAFTLLKLVLVLAVLFFGGIILYGTITEYKPKPESHEAISVNEVPGSQTPSDTIRLLNWNIGFGGLGAEMDFFYDGGKSVRAPRTVWDKDMNGILQTLTQSSNIDFYLLQEVDVASKRSYFVNQFDSIGDYLQRYASAFAVNYNVQHVPLPFTRPLGKVYSGVATFSAHQVAEAQRYQYPGSFPWPTRIFFLDRCFLVTAIPWKSSTLLVINTHNSAYDETGELKAQEMAMLMNYATDAYKKGHYVIIGGDFNQCPPGFNPHAYEPDGFTGFAPPAMPDNFIPDGWKTAFDDQVPTNRHLDRPFSDASFKTVIDFYIVSPNVQIQTIQGIDLNFAYSDHQPVYLEVTLD